MKKKRSGSVILMVLMVSTVMIIISAAVSSSLVSTTLGNTIEKYKNDYIYAAEGGLELGIQRYNTGNFVNFTIPFLETINNDSKRGIEEVRVEIDSQPTGKFLSSKAIRTEGSIEKILAEVRVPIGGRKSINNILECSIYSSSDLVIKSEGPINFNGSIISYKENKDDIENLGPYVPANEEREEVNPIAPKFKNEIVKYKSPEVKVDSLNTLWNYKDPLTGDELITTIDVSSLDIAPTVVEHGVGKFEIDSFPILAGDMHGVHMGRGYKVIFVNSPKLVIDLPESIPAQHQYIIICSGKIEFKSSHPPTPAFMNAGTLYGDGVYIHGTANLVITGSPMNPGVTGHNKLRSDQMQYLDKILSTYMTNWGAEVDGSDGALGNEINLDDVEYIIP